MMASLRPSDALTTCQSTDAYIVQAIAWSFLPCGARESSIIHRTSPRTRGNLGRDSGHLTTQYSSHDALRWQVSIILADDHAVYRAIGRLAKTE